MRTIAYGAFLVLLLAGSLFLLKSIGPSGERSLPARGSPVALSGAPEPVDLEDLGDATPAELHALGVEMLNMWHVREATEVFERAVAADSTLFGTWLRLIECYAHPLVSREADARAAARHAERTAAHRADSTIVSGLGALYAERNYARAVTSLSGLLRGRSTTEGARYHLALAYFQLGRLGDASKHLDKLMDADATVGPVVELYVRRAVAAEDLGRAADAARELARMYTEEPFPYVLLAQVEMARRNGDAATEFCNNALALDPRYAPAIVTRAHIYADAGEFESARVSFEKLLLFDDLILKCVGQEGIGFVGFLAGDFDVGADAMDEAIRQAMLIGSVRRGLSISSRLVEYLCELGQPDAAQGVVDRWVTGFGEVAVRLARLRIQLLRGDFESARETLELAKTDEGWLSWARTLSLDLTELAALADIGEQRQKQALALLSGGGMAAVAAGALERRTFLRGYASFESGDAEAAAVAFADVHRRLYGLESPYHGDPVLYVQSLFFLAESELARGNEVAARSSYEAFLGYWGEASWDLDAVERARDKLEALDGMAAPEG